MEKIISKNFIPNKSYSVRASGTKPDGTIVTSQIYFFKAFTDDFPPPVVTNLDADFKGRDLVVVWNGTAAKAEKDFKNFRIKITSPNVENKTLNDFRAGEQYVFSKDANRKLFGSFQGSLEVTVYSVDTGGNQSAGVSINVNSEIPTAPTNVKLSASTLGYVVSWDLPVFENYDYTKVYDSTSENGTYSVVRTERGTSTYVPKSIISPVWVKVSHVNTAGAESALVASVPPSITPIDPVPTDVTPPAVPTNLNWEDAGTESINGITTAAMRAHWEVSEITSGYKVRVTEDIINKDNWAVYDVPASKATVTFKSVSSNVATLTLTAHSFAKDDYVTIFNMGSPFDGKRKITSVTPTTISFSLTTGDIANTAATGNVVISSYTVKELYPGTTYYGAILAYDSANNLTQFVSEGTFSTSGVAGTVGKKITIDGTSMAFGPNVDPTQTFDGLYIDSDNYWYNTGLFNAGTPGNAISWDGLRLRLDGSLVARGGSFTGNIFLSSQKASVGISSASLTSNIATLTSSVSHGFNPGDQIIISGTPTTYIGTYTILSTPSLNTFTYSKTNANISQANVSLSAVLVSSDTTSSIIATDYYNIQSASYSNGVGTIVLTETPSNMSVGNSIYVSLTSSIFDGQYVIDTINSSTITFKMSPSVGSPSTINNTGRVANLSSGDRVIFNANGIQAVEGSDVVFSLNRSRTHKLGGFTIRPARLFAGSQQNYIALASTGTWRLWAGNEDPSIAPFRLNGEGNIRAYGIFSSSSEDSGTRVAIGADVSGTKDGILLDETSITGYENFWYIPSTVSTGNTFFQVGTSNGSGISVKRIGNGAGYPKVYIKDYNLEGTNVFEANGILDLGNGIKLGKNLNSSGVDGLILNNDNYWHYNTSDTKYKFRVGASGNSNYLLFQDGVLTVSGDINVVGGNAATTTQLANKLDSSSFTGINIISAVNSQVLNDNTGNGISIGNTIVSGQVYPRIATLSHLTFSSTGAGFFLGRDDSDGQYKFFVGDGVNDKLEWTGSQLVVKGKLRTNDTDKTRISMETGNTAAKLNFFHESNIGSARVTVKSGTSTESTPGTIEIFSGATYTTETGVIWKFSGPTKNTYKQSPYLSFETSATSSRLRLEVPTDFGVVRVEGKDFDIATETVTFSNAGTKFESIGDKTDFVSTDYVLGKNSSGYLRWFPQTAIGSGGGGTTYQAGIGIEIDTSTNPDSIRNTGFRMNGSTSDPATTRSSSQNRITYGNIALVPTGKSDGDIHIEF